MGRRSGQVTSAARSELTRGRSQQMSTPRRNLQLILGSLAAHVLFGANAATAQQPAQSAADQSSGAGVLQEVVVTAQRRTENVLKVPLSVTVVSGDTLVDRGANDLTAV